MTTVRIASKLPLISLIGTLTMLCSGRYLIGNSANIRDLRVTRILLSLLRFVTKPSANIPVSMMVGQTRCWLLIDNQASTVLLFRFSKLWINYDDLYYYGLWLLDIVRARTIRGTWKFVLFSLPNNIENRHLGVRLPCCLRNIANTTLCYIARRHLCRLY